MRQNTMKAASLSAPLLTVVKGSRNAQAEISALVNAAWNFAYTALWNTTLFSNKEINAAKERIHEYLTLSKYPRKAFVSFCQRVLLARYVVNSAKGRSLPLPSLWFDKEYALGFVETRKWFYEIRRVRESLPNYKKDIKALAEAVLEFSEEPTVQNYNFWREYFIERATPGLLNLFQVTAIHQLCN